MGRSNWLKDIKFGLMFVRGAYAKAELIEILEVVGKIALHSYIWFAI